MATLLNPPTPQASDSGAARPLQFWYLLRHLAGLWHLASLDAPTVAVTWAWAFCRAANVPLHLWAAAALALIVWTIYIVDRLLDARAGLRTPPAHRLRDRHHFHWNHRRILLPLATLSGLAAAVLVFSQLPARSVRPDSLVAAATLLWLTSVHAGRAPEVNRNHSRITELRSEIIVGALFTLGCALPVSSQLGAAHSLAQFLKLPLLPLFLYAALAWLNLHAINAWESHRDRHVQRPAAILVLTALALAAFAQPRSAALLVAGAGSALLFLLLDRNRERLSPLALRAAADLVLLTPLLLIPLLLL